MPKRSLRSHPRLDLPAFLAVLLVLFGLLAPTWAVAGPCCEAGKTGKCCCVAGDEAHSGTVHSCCAGPEKLATPSPCDLPGGCSCRAVPQARVPLFVAPATLEEGGRSDDALDWLATGWLRAGLEAESAFAFSSTGEDRAPPRVGPGDAPRPRGALRRGLRARLAELSVARI